ncbi:MAG: [protein-PII] uridylyltransferase [Pseudomonadota bacterium]
MSTPATELSEDFSDLLDRSDQSQTDTQFYRSAVAAGEERLRQTFPGCESAWSAIKLRAKFIDLVLTECWRAHVQRSAMALVAVGGYGRMALHPYSDIDVMILYSGDLSADDEECLSKFITLLWDLKLDIGHSVRTVEQCVEESLRDVTVITNLLEARLVTGNADLLKQMRRKTAGKQIWPADQFFMAKRDEQRERHIKFQDTSYRLEPNVKESPGGMRDIQTLRWISKRLFRTDDLRVLVEKGFLYQEEVSTLENSEDFLCKARYALHTIAGRKEDRLLFDHQREIAHAFGYTVDENNQCIEQFMQRYYRAVMALERLNELLLQLIDDYFNSSSKTSDIKPINARFRVNKQHIEVTGESVFVEHPPALLELFLLSAKDPDIQGIRAGTIRLIRRHHYLIDENFRNNLECKTLFIALLAQPQGITHQLRLMNRYGVLAKYIPQFEKIVGRMQYDLFHIYTVDEHTLMVVRNMRRYFIDKHRDELPHCFQVARSVDKPELLYLMGLFHDIAKGRGGDHSLLGAQDALEFCTQHELGAVDSGLVAWAVENHLLMSMTMQRRDISDPEVVYEFAKRVSTKTHLDYLYLLTVADIRGTSPELWNSWKNSLLITLYDSTVRVLSRGLDNPINRDAIVKENRQDAMQKLIARNLNRDDIETLWNNLGDDYFLRYYADEICWHTPAMIEHGNCATPLVLVRQDERYNSTEIFIYCRDRDNLFAHITTAIGNLSLNVISARIVTSTTGHALDRFRVLDHDGHAIRDTNQLKHIQYELEQSLSSPTVEPLRLSRPLNRRLKMFSVPTAVTFDNQVTAGWTSVTVIGTDRPGALSRIANAFLSCDVSVHAAKVATFGEKLEDVFFVTHRDGHAVTEEASLDQIETALIDHLSDDTTKTQ